MNLPKRTIPLILVALLVAGGAWLNYATPSTRPGPPVPVERAGPQPTLAPLPPAPVASPAPTAAAMTEVEVSYEVAPLPQVIVAPPPKAPAPPSVAKPTAKPPVKLAEKPQANCQPSDCWQHYRRGWFRRR